MVEVLKFEVSFDVFFLQPFYPSLSRMSNLDCKIY